MLVFGHVGITAGIIKVYEKAAKKKNSKNDCFIDYRIVIAGSLLPDIIDKPLVQILYGLRNHDGHLIAHSFIFSGLLIVLGMIIICINENKSVFTLGICSLIHQLLDKLMSVPNIFFLPNVNSRNFIALKRLAFVHNITLPIYTRFPYLRDTVLYFEKPYIFISETIGFIIIIYFICRIIAGKGRGRLLKLVSQRPPRDANKI